MPNKTRQNKLMIEIPAPQFDLYEFLTLYWNEQERTVKVVRCWFDLEDNQWWYGIFGEKASSQKMPHKIQNSEVLYPEKAFSVVEAVS